MSEINEEDAIIFFVTATVEARKIEKPVVIRLKKEHRGSRVKVSDGYIVIEKRFRNKF